MGARDRHGANSRTAFCQTTRNTVVVGHVRSTSPSKGYSGDNYDIPPCAFPRDDMRSARFPSECMRLDAHR